jgi:hypothetical protein
MDGPSYLARLTLDDVEACAAAAEELFQRDPYGIPARTAAGWAELAELMRRTNANVVADLGAEATGKWETELGFSVETPADDGRWPRDREPVERPPARP